MNKQPPKSKTQEPRRPFTTRDEPAYQAYQTHKPSTPAGAAVGTLIYENNRDADNRKLPSNSIIKFVCYHRYTISNIK